MRISKVVIRPAGFYKKPLRLLHESDEKPFSCLFHTSLCVFADHEQDSYYSNNSDIVQILLLSPCFACMVGVFLHASRCFRLFAKCHVRGGLFTN